MSVATPDVGEAYLALDGHAYRRTDAGKPLHLAACSCWRRPAGVCRYCRTDHAGGLCRWTTWLAGWLGGRRG